MSDDGHSFKLLGVNDGEVIALEFASTGWVGTLEVDAHKGLAGFNGRDDLAGFGGDDASNGGIGAGILAGDRGRDIMTGGTGADVVKFSGRFDVDTITDFNVAADVLDSGAGSAEAQSVEAFLASCGQRGNSVRYEALDDGKNVIILENVTLAELSAAEHVFVI